MALAKIDIYDYMILPGIIRINLTGTNDPILVDILSEIDQSNGRIYVDGDYYLFMGYAIITDGNQSYLELQVTQTN